MSEFAQHWVHRRRQRPTSNSRLKYIWDIASCREIKCYRCFGGAYCLHTKLLPLQEHRSLLKHRCGNFTSRIISVIEQRYRTLCIFDRNRKPLEICVVQIFQLFIKSSKRNTVALQHINSLPSNARKFFIYIYIIAACEY